MKRKYKKVSTKRKNSKFRMRRTEIACKEPKMREQDQTEKISRKQDKKRKNETWIDFMKDEKIIIIYN